MIEDGRGSKPQRHLHKLLEKIYPIYTIVYEQEIPELNQRIDLLVLELGIAIEYDGRQHDEYVDFFHKDIGNFIKGKRHDRHKEEYCAENGIKLVRIKGNIEDWTEEDLRREIDKTDFPEILYNKNCFRKHKPVLEKARAYRKEQYKKTKESISKLK